MGLPVRPTTDMAKEGLFNILNTFLEFGEIEVCDLFAGTGNITFEFASRGCREVTAVEINAKCIAFIQKTISDLGFTNITPMKADVFSFLFRSQKTFDFVFADPPYDLEHAHELPDKIIHSALKPEGWLVLEHGPDSNYSTHPAYHHTRHYGKVHFSFFQKTT
jgi:16S rRNA (guanine(966)-N(2))-methyltransferase RsmD